MSAPIPLIGIEPSAKQRASRPKGFAPYRPQQAQVPAVAEILALYERMEAADALPLGPRQVGYRLKELHPGQYDKGDFKRIEEMVKRLGQARRLDFDWIADAASVSYDPGGWDSLADFARDVPAMHRRDRRHGQPTVVEVYAEARETLPLIQRLARERGVTVYSGGGSSGPKLAHRVALRAVRRAVEREQSTVILGIADFDQAGIRNILRPHLEHLAAFLYGTARNETVVAWAPPGNGSEPLAIFETGCQVGFEHLALTPRQALNLVSDPADRTAVHAYMADGAHLWDRDLDLLDGVQKVETEALDPPDLRRLVTTTLDALLDGTALRRVADEEQAERVRLGAHLAGFPATAETANESADDDEDEAEASPNLPAHNPADMGGQVAADRRADGEERTPQ